MSTDGRAPAADRLSLLTAPLLLTIRDMLKSTGNAAHQFTGTCRALRDLILSDLQTVRQQVSWCSPGNDNEQDLEREYNAMARFLNRACRAAPAGLKVVLELDQYLKTLVGPGLAHPGAWERVHHLEVSHNAGDPAPIEFPLGIAFGHIRTLVLTHVCITSVMLDSLASSCHHLTSLGLQDCTVEGTWSAAATVLARLTSLSLADGGDELLELLQAPLPHLTELRIRWIDTTHCRYWLQYLCEQTSLTSLSLMFIDPSHPSRRAIQQSRTRVKQLLESCTQLGYLGLQPVETSQAAFEAMIKYGKQLKVVDLGPVQVQQDLACTPSCDWEVMHQYRYYGKWDFDRLPPRTLHVQVCDPDVDDPGYDPDVDVHIAFGLPFAAGPTVPQIIRILQRAVCHLSEDYPPDRAHLHLTCGPNQHQQGMPEGFSLATLFRALSGFKACHELRFSLDLPLQGLSMSPEHLAALTRSFSPARLTVLCLHNIEVQPECWAAFGSEHCFPDLKHLALQPGVTLAGPPGAATSNIDAFLQARSAWGPRMTLLVAEGVAQQSGTEQHLRRLKQQQEQEQGGCTGVDIQFCCGEAEVQQAEEDEQEDVL